MSPEQPSGDSPPEQSTDFELVDDDEPVTDFELVRTSTEVSLVRARGGELVPHDPETGFRLVEDDDQPTGFRLVEDDEPPDIVPAEDATVARYGIGNR